jgi:hypothetical protein
MCVAKTHHCNLKGVEMQALKLFKIFSGTDGPASEFEFHAQGTKAPWIKLARHLMSASLPSPLNDPLK